MNKIFTNCNEERVIINISLEFKMCGHTPGLKPDFRTRQGKFWAPKPAARGGGGVWGHAPPENIEIWRLRNALLCIFHGIFFRKVNLGPKSRQGNCLVLPHASYSPALNHMNSVHMYQFHQIERERERLQCSIIQLFIPSCNCYTTKYRMLISWFTCSTEEKTYRDFKLGKLSLLPAPY